MKTHWCGDFNDVYEHCNALRWRKERASFCCQNEVLIGDNGTQYTSGKFSQFVSEWKFRHIRSAPGNEKAKDAAEVAVKVIKNKMMMKCLKSNEDRYIALLDLRNTPLEDLTTSPAMASHGSTRFKYHPIHRH
ncbi:hypothetical protein RRG08_060426 [Elysia crispata]|uniref:Integrase catalytic domain-containing protein n=1 Tax=Elysia crispata TaxID=231223 RepID=A0AAE1ALI5_9GAST|nr:hypothetical protein RRG08_060426 [Elysia crispata]